MTTLALDDATIEAIAHRVADLLRADVPQPEDDLLDAGEAAKRLRVSRDYVYAHAADLGAIPIGDGERPRLRFPVAEIDRACLSSRRTQATASPGPAPKTSRRRPRPLGTDGELLPIRGEIRA